MSLSLKYLQKVLDTQKKFNCVQEAADYLGVPTRTYHYQLSKARENIEYLIPDGQNLKGVSSFYKVDEDGKKILTRQWVKTDADRETAKEFLSEIIEGLKADLPKVKPISPPKDYDQNLMAILPMGDPHFGLYCWAEEVGNAFNLEIAKNDLCGAVNHLVSQGPACERCVIINLGDFFHADNMDGKTSRSGHNMDMAGRLPDMVKVGMSALRYCIEKALEKHKVVEVICVPGNHDDVLGFALSISLDNIYENEPRIVIHNNPRLRYYIEHGKVLIGATHGHDTKQTNLPLLMATEMSEAWGRTTHRYFYNGHYHHDKRIEMNGCMIEQFRTLAPSDAYSHGKGYLSGCDMKSILMHKEFGEVGRTICSIEMLRTMSDKG